MDNNEHSTNLAEVGTDAISRQDALEAFGLSKKTRKYGGDHSGYDTMMMYEIQDTIEGLPPIQPVSSSETPNSSDVISRQQAIDAMAELQGRASSKGELTGISKAWKRIKKLQPIQPAEPKIIRCKDCKNWDTTWTNDFSPNYHYCPMVDGVRKEDWYCADAERITE